MKTVGDVCAVLEAFAPLSLQESYDNAGLILGNRDQEVTGILIALDATLDIIDEAVNLGCNLIVTHHPFQVLQTLIVVINCFLLSLIMCFVGTCKTH